MTIRTEQEAIQVLNDYEQRLEALSTQVSKLTFQRFVDKQPNPQLNELKKERSKLSLDPHFHELINEWSAKVTHPYSQMRFTKWEKQLALVKVNAHPEVEALTQQLDEKMVTHRYLYGDERVELSTIRETVKAHPDSKEREKAWRAYEELSISIDEQLLQLIKTRNAVAKQDGFDTFVDLVLNVSDLNKNDVVNTLNELTGATQSDYENILHKQAEATGLASINPWDVQYLLDQYAGDTTASFKRDNIIPSLNCWAEQMDVDLAKLGLEIVYTDIPYNGLCMAIDRQTIKVLGNPQNGYSYYRTAFHEMGHALHGLLKEVDDYGLRMEPSIFNEGMAETFGYITNHPEWIQSFGLSEKDAQKVIEGSKGPQYHYLRQRSAFCLFEYALYENPDQNLDQLLGKTESNILGGNLDTTSRWAANPWFVNFPVYWQNYVLADVIASQIHEHLKTNVGELHRSKDAFHYVVEHYIKQGGTVPWLQKVEQGTGGPLRADALISDMLKEV